MTDTTASLDLENIQGDILEGIAKKTELFIFFQIDDHRIDAFRKRLSQLVPLITATPKASNDRAAIRQSNEKAAKEGRQRPLLKNKAINLAFSQKALIKLGLKDDLGDDAFKNGMLADAQKLGDPGSSSSSSGFKPDWIPAFKRGDIDGLIMLAGDCFETIHEEVKKIEEIFLVDKHNAVIHEVLKLVGDVRPGKENGHEHFGFKDGISQPGVGGFTKNPFPGQDVIDPGFILLGQNGDVNAAKRPSWAVDGSFLSFRYLFQLVPEFDEFLKQNPIPGLPPNEGSELLGARLVGRWKSGAPIDITPVKDDPLLGADANRNNNFQYDFPPDDPQTQTRCPYAAHTRKTYPRDDLEKPPPPTQPIDIDKNRIIRRGIPFGQEVTRIEAEFKKTLHARGLLFVAYSASIVDGFRFLQETWANNVNFPPFKTATPTPGFDPIIGQNGGTGPRTLVGTNPSSQANTLSLPTAWVVPKGGEYFFSPSIKALKETFSLPSGGHDEL